MLERGIALLDSPRACSVRVWVVVESCMLGQRKESHSIITNNSIGKDGSGDALLYWMVKNDNDGRQDGFK